MEETRCAYRILGETFLKATTKKRDGQIRKISKVFLF